jgi:hypothetical protein
MVGHSVMAGGLNDSVTSCMLPSNGPERVISQWNLPPFTGTPYGVVSYPVLPTDLSFLLRRAPSKTTEPRTMNPIDPQPTQFQLPAHSQIVRYAENQQHLYQPLPSIKTPDGRVVSQWIPSPHELAALNKGIPVTLILHTYNQPLQPIILGVGGMDLRPCPMDTPTFVADSPTIQGDPPPDSKEDLEAHPWKTPPHDPSLTP